MKIAATLALAALASVASADRTFHAGNHTGDGEGAHNGTAKIKSAANFGNGGAKIELCPSGDCVNGQLIVLSMSRLAEITSDNKPAQKADNFASLNVAWTDFETMEMDGVETMSTSYIADVDVAKAGTAKFNLTATIYTGNGTAMNGNQTIDVPAGALKFSVSVANWPFKADTNKLQFGISLRARGKDKKDRGAPSKKAKGGNHTDIERVDMGEGMFMDAPTLAVVDGVDTEIGSTIETAGGKTTFVWTFPHFATSVYYDPVTGSEDESASPTSTTTTTTTTTDETPTPTPSKTSGASGMAGWGGVMSSVAMASVLAITSTLLF